MEAELQRARLDGSRIPAEINCHSLPWRTNGREPASFITRPNSSQAGSDESADFV
jgi:hypothetical protein